jgi:hypothetical protein
MGFGGKKPMMEINIDRVAAVAGVSAPLSSKADAHASTQARRVSVEPDMSRIRKSSIDETPEERKKRLAAKTVNFGATIIARLIILGAAGFYTWMEFQSTGKIHRGFAIGIFVMLADFGRVVLKAMEPGSK